MASPIKISIPSPCHEDWANMTPGDRGRFCAACQKSVIDFTCSTDREIIKAYNREANLCGRFRPQQLEREFTLPKEKNSLWEVGATAIALLALGTNGAVAQTPADTIQHEMIGKFRVDSNLIIISGIVLDEQDLPLPGVTVTCLPHPDVATTDIDGRFSIPGIEGDTLVFESVGYAPQKFAINIEGTYTLQLNEKLEEIVIIGYKTQRQSYIMGAVTTVKAEDLQIKRRTFFGRIFHAIGNIFR